MHFLLESSVSPRRCLGYSLLAVFTSIIEHRSLWFISCTDDLTKQNQGSAKTVKPKPLRESVRQRQLAVIAPNSFTYLFCYKLFALIQLYVHGNLRSAIMYIYIYIYIYIYTINNGLVVKVLDFQSRGPVFKTMVWL